MPSRRSVLVGLGGLVAGGGALIGTGAFTTVEAERTVSVQTEGDEDAFLGLRPAQDDEDNGEYAQLSDGGGGTDTVEITLNSDASGGNTGSGLNANARTVIRRIVQVSNNGTQNVTSLSLSITDADNNNTFPDTFGFTCEDQPGTTFENGDNILDGDLAPGDVVDFGLEIDLIDGGTDDGELPGTGDFNLTITANTSESQGQ